VPPPGADNPHEVPPPLYSPDQLRLRHKLIPDVPLGSQVISLLEQVQQAAALKVALTAEQLQNANPLLGPKGPVKVPEQASPDEFPDGYAAICAIVKNQHRDIREWLEYHRWLGVSKVYVYDNNSTVRGAAGLRCVGCDTLPHAVGTLECLAWCCLQRQLPAVLPFSGSHSPMNPAWWPDLPQPP
jgi:hypothetical protein